MRTDKLISLFIQKILRTGDYNRIPILMYHSVTTSISRTGNPYFCTEITPETFKNQLSYLKENGYDVIQLSQVPILTKNKFKDLGKKAVITFDDGYKDFFIYALPILREYKYPATVFLPAELIGTNNNLEGKKLMNWGEVHECKKYSIQFGSHSLLHEKLVQLDNKKLEYNLVKSKGIIETQLSEQIDSFSFPYKFPEENNAFIKIFINLLKKSDYQINVTTRIGRVSINDNPLLMKRIPANEFDDDALFHAKLTGAYDWLHMCQYSVKKIRTLFKNNKTKRV